MKIQLLTFFSIFSLCTFSQGNNSLENPCESYIQTKKSAFNIQSDQRISENSLEVKEVKLSNIDLNISSTDDDPTTYDSTFIRNYKHTRQIKVGQYIKLNVNRQVQLRSGKMKIEKYNLRGTIQTLKKDKLILETSNISSTSKQNVDTIIFNNINSILIFNDNTGKRLLGGLLRAAGTVAAIGGTFFGVALIVDTDYYAEGAAGIGIGVGGVATWFLGSKIRGWKYKLKGGKWYIYQH